MRIKIFLLLILMLGVLTGCMPNQSVEENAIIQIAGYDLAEEEKIRGTVSIPQYGRDEKKTSASEIYLSVTAKSIKDVEREIQKQSSKPISIGKLAVTLYSEEVAKEDLSDIIDILSRDPRLSRNMYLGVTKGDARSLIEGGYSQDETTSKHLQGLLENNMYYNFPHSSLHDFLYAYYSKGMDGFLPYLIKNESFVELGGIALFDKGKMVTTIPGSQVFTFKMMKENFNKGMQDLHFKNGVVMMDNIGSNVNYRLKGTVKKPEFVIDIQLKGVVNEMVDIEEKVNEKLAKEMEEVFEKHYEKEAQSMIDMFQEEGIDPLGLGRFLKTRKRGFEEKQWEEVYPDTPIKVKVTLEITEYGIFS